MKRALGAGAAVVLALAVGAGACRRTPARGPTPESADQRRSPAEWLREEPVRLLADYLRIDTTATKGEREGVEYLRRLFECEGIETEVVCPAPGRCNLLARLPGRTREGALLLLNHVDVADAFANFWKEPPFGATIKLGYLYGRGAYDMKSFGIAQFLAMREVKRRGIVPPSDILYLAEADEELGQAWGSRWLLDHRAEWFKGLRWVVNEGGTTELLLRTPRYWGIETVQGGYAFVELEAASGAPLKTLAEKFPRVVSAPVVPHPHVLLAFDILANHLPSPYTDPLRHLDRVRADPAELAILPDRYGSFLEARIRWSDLYESPAAPGKSRGYVSVAVPPGVDPAPYLAPLLAEAGRLGVRTVNAFDSGPTKASDYPSALTDLLQRVTEAHYPGVPFGPIPGFGGFTTSLLFRDRGYEVYGYSPFAMNITDTARRHWNDERIYLRDYVSGVALFTDVLLEYAMVGLR